MDVLEVDRVGSQVTVVRVPPAGPRVSRAHAVQVGAFDVARRVLARTPTLVGDRPVPVALPAGTVLVVPDSADDTWARMRLTPPEWAVLGDVLGQMGDPAARVVLFNAVRDAVRNAELSPARALDLLCAGALSEQSDVVLSSVLGFALGQLAGPYAAPADRAARRQQVHATARTVLQQSAAGSDHQLAAFRSVLASCDDADPLQAWLDSARLPEGVELDPELRWALVRRLTSLTGDGDLIEATLAGDPSGSAPGHAAQARAGLPSGAAKEAAWRILMSPTGASAYEAYATAQGFFDPAQADLTAPYVNRYFEEVGQMATFRHGWSLGKVALLAYPSPASTPETLAHAEQALVRGGFSAPVARALVDGTDRLRRAVASRRRFDAN
jgi:aminopeptidase N